MRQQLTQQLTQLPQSKQRANSTSKRVVATLTSNQINFNLSSAFEDPTARR
jgi:hypothetical protein